MRRIYRPPWRIDLTVRAGVPRLLGGAELGRIVAAALNAAGAPGPASLGLILAGDHELARLNATHMGQPGPTDVLSFPLLPPETYPPHAGGSASGVGSEAASAAERRSAAEQRSTAGPDGFALPPGTRPHLGDVAVSVERAIEQAKGGRGGWTGDVRWSPADELRLLVTHGVLHICGWDHAQPAEEAAMRALEARLLGRAGPG